jgi:hypothetical protein
VLAVALTVAKVVHDVGAAGDATKTGEGDDDALQVRPNEQVLGEDQCREQDAVLHPLRRAEEQPEVSCLRR